MGPHFRLCLLGTPRICSSDQPINGFRTRKALALFCYLAARATDLDAQIPLSRTRLADLFWGDFPEAKGRSNLSYALHNLNDLFPGALVATRDTIALDESVLSIDAREFRAQAVVGTAESLARAARLYHDEFMAGLFLDDCPEFELWLVSERERWRQRIVSVLECLGGYHARLAEYDRALPYAVRILEIEPWREEAHRHMMQLYARTGQRSAALQQYETCRRVLAEELGAEPGAETLALFEKIRAEEMSPPRAAAPHNLPTPLTSFVGREADLARIDARLKNPDCRLLTLVGAGGIGKTRLALETGAKYLETFEDGVFLAPLASLGPGQSEFIVPAIANALAFTFAGPQEPKTQLLNFLREKKMLLILDNFEQLLCRDRGANGTEPVLEILQRAPDVKIIVTSREPLNVQAEWITRLGGLSYPTSPGQEGRDEQDRVSSYSAVQLFVERAGRLDQDFALDAETSAPVVRICQSVEGMPLALELAAAALNSLPIGKIAEQIASDVDLASSMRDVEVRHQSLRAVLDWSYGLLSPDEQMMLRRLSVFAGGCTLESAMAVCAEETIQPPRVAELLERLVEKSLLLLQAQGEARRYRMLESVRQYARDKLDEAGGTQTVLARHREYFLKLAEQAEPRLKTAEQDAWLEKLDRENDNLRAALRSGPTADPITRQELRLAGALTRFWLLRGYLSEGLEWMTGAVATNGPVGRTAERAKALFGLGVLALEQGKLNTAREALDESIGIARESDDKQIVAYALAWRGWIEIHQGNFDTASAMLQESLQLARSVRDDWGVAYAVSLLHLLSAQRLDFEAARAYGQEGVTLFRQSGDKWGLAWLLQRLGQFNYTFERDFVQARALLKEALALARRWKNKKLVADTLWQLGLLAVFELDAARARIRAEEALTLSREMEHQEMMFRALNVLGEAARVGGDYAHAASHYAEALQLARQVGSMRVIGMTAINLAFARLRENDREQAERLLAECREILESTQDKTVLATYLAGAGAAAIARGRFLQGVRLFAAADAQFVRNGTTLEPVDQAEFDHYLDIARTELGAAEFEEAWVEGGALLTIPSLAPIFGSARAC